MHTRSLSCRALMVSKRAYLLVQAGCQAWQQCFFVACYFHSFAEESGILSSRGQRRGLQTKFNGLVY